MLSKMFNLIIRHKFTTVITLLIVIIGGYFGYQAISGSNEAVRYTVAAVKRSTLIVSISGSGQVSSSDQVDIKPKVSGDVVYVGAKDGQELKAGALLVQIDIGEAEKAVRDAETDLETVKLELDKLFEPVNELDLLRAENNLVQAEESKQKAEDNIIEAYEDAFNAISNAFLDLPTIITGLRDILYSYEIAESEITVSNYSWNISTLKNLVDYQDRYKLEKFIDSAESDYKAARTRYDENFENYKNTSRYSDKDVIKTLLEETLETVRAMAEAVKSENNMLDFWVDDRSEKDLRTVNKVTEYQSDIKSLTSKTNSHLLSLLSIQRSIQDSKEDVLNAERSIEEIELSLAELKAGADELDIRAKKITIQQKEDVLLDAKEDLENHYIYAPFNSMIAEINVDEGDSVSSNTVLATLITQQKIAEVTFNEIDAVNIKVGQKTTLTFDALPKVSISGKVIGIDTMGQVTQGVVSYGVKIASDTDVEQVKPGMSVTVDIITEAKQNVLVLPSSAIKFQGDVYYVELVEADEEFGQQLLTNVSGIILPTSPKSQSIEVGISNDLSSEIISGLKEGDIVVTSAINQVQGTTQTQGFMMPGMSGGKSIRYLK